MDPKLDARLGVDAYEIGVKSVKVAKWGAELIFECVYNPMDLNKPFDLILKKCQNIQWTVDINDPDLYQDETAVISLDLGDENYQRPFNMLTGLFDIVVSYKEWTVRKDW